MRLALLALAAVTLAACDQIPADDGGPDMGPAHGSPDMAKSHAAPADMAKPITPPPSPPDMAEAPQPPADMAEPECPILPTCDFDKPCCNGGTCTDHFCWAAPGQACDVGGSKGPICLESQCWPSNAEGTMGVCR